MKQLKNYKIGDRIRKHRQEFYSPINWNTFYEGTIVKKEDVCGLFIHYFYRVKKTVIEGKSCPHSWTIGDIFDFFGDDEAVINLMPQGACCPRHLANTR